MIITKLGHCCLLIETKGKRILTDPGSFTIESSSKLTNIDFILFTHEHQDHYHLDSLKTILQNNPHAVVYSNSSVDELLIKENIKHIRVNHADAILLGDIQVTGIGEKHAIMHKSIPASSNIGYLIDEKLWYPGDSYTDPKRPVDVLALPVSGPWMKIGEAIDYAIMLNPRKVFPVHDAIRFESQHTLTAKILEEKGIIFEVMVEGDRKEF